MTLSDAELAVAREELVEAGLEQPVYDFIPLGADAPRRLMHVPGPPIVARGGWTDWWRPRER